MVQQPLVHCARVLAYAAVLACTFGNTKAGLAAPPAAEKPNVVSIMKRSTPLKISFPTPTSARMRR